MRLQCSVAVDETRHASCTCGILGRNMTHPPRQRQPATQITIGGQQVNVKLEVANTTGAGPIDLPGDTKMPKSAVSARTQQGMHMSQAGGSSLVFSNPKQNVHRLGFREGMKVADFGSGSGAYTLALANVVGDSGVVYAVDVQRELLTRVQNMAVQKGLENIHIVWGDIESQTGVAIKDGILDGVLLSNTLFQVENKNAVVKEAWRVLKPGGLLSVIDWTDSFGGLGPPQSDVVSQSETMLICTDNGFAFKNDFNAGDHHYGVIFLKVGTGETRDQTIQASHNKDEDFIARTVGQELL